MHINKRYKLIRSLGKGAQGNVFEVFDELRLKSRALKLCSSSTTFSLESEFIRLFEIRHPNLAQVYDFQVVNHLSEPSDILPGTAFFTEELVYGIPADEYIASAPPASRWREIAYIGIGVARALRMLHSRGVLHLDVKPSNILVSPDGEPKLIDLGLARSRDNAAGIKVGTLGYMAQEVYDGLADESTDVYALGQVLIQLCGNQKPPIGFLEKAIIPKDVPDAFAAVLACMVNSSMERRYTARESILAIVKSGIIEKESGEQYLDDASNADDASSRFALTRSTTFIGREFQLRQLGQFIDASKHRSPVSVCIINGPVGIGKTRLVRKVIAAKQVEAAQTHEPSIHFISGTMFSIVQLAQNIATDEDALILGSWLIHFFSNYSEAYVDEEDVYISEKVMDCLLSTLASSSSPTVILIEDAPSSLIAYVLHYLNENVLSSENRVSLILESSTLVDLFSTDNQIEYLELDPLSLEQESMMVAGIVGEMPSSDAMTAFCKRTGGNPRFIEALVEQWIRWGEHSGLETFLNTQDLPDAPEQLVARKLFAITQGKNRELLFILAVATIPISLHELVAASNIDDGDSLESFIAAMKKAGYLHTSHAEHRTVQLVPFVARGLSQFLAPKQRSGIHGKLFLGLDKSRPVEQLALHAFCARLFDDAAVYLGQASAEAINVGNMVRAIAYLEMLRECQPVPKETTTLELATCYRKSGQYEKALVLTEELLAKGAASRSRVLLEQAAVLRLNGNSRAAMQLLSPLVKNRDDKEVYGTALALSARIHLDNGDANKGLELLDGLNFNDESAHQMGLLNILGLLYLTCAQLDKAQEFFQRGLAVVQGMSPIEEGRYYSYLGMVAHAKEDWNTAARQYESAFRLADEFGDRHGAATYAVNWAAALTEQGDVSNALVRYRNGMGRLRGVGRPDELVQAESNYAQLLLRLGDAVGALEVTNSAVLDMFDVDNPLVRGIVLTAQGEALAANGDIKSGMLVLEEAMKELNQVQQPFREQYCLLHLCELYLQQGKVASAYQQLPRITDDSVRASYDFLSLQVQLALQGKGKLEDTVGALLGQLPSNIEELSFAHYKAICVSAIALYHLEDIQKWPQQVVSALSLIEKIRTRTPALHRPAVYPFELQLQKLNVQAEEITKNHQDDEQEVNMRNIWLERLMRITARLNSELNVNSQLNIIMDTAIDVTSAERGFLLLRDDTGEFSVRSARNMDSEALLKKEQNYSGTIARRAFDSRELIVTTNAQEDERYREYRSIANLNLMYIVAVPLLVKGIAQGAIYLDSTSRGRFDKERIELLKVLANQAAIALTNAKLVSHVQVSNEQIERLNTQLANQLAHTEQELAQTRRDLREINENLASKYSFYGIIGASKKMKDMFRMLERIAPTDIPVVISGESGTGKELVAKAIHQAGARREESFVAENCAAIPSTLLESILFGHVRGAFTGAVAKRNGLFVEAHKGTLFLDEIAEMPLAMQSKLLRVLQEGEVRPVGQNSSIKVDVRILVASNSDLKLMVKKGTFREDLFYRLHVMEVSLPPLRDRGEDIPTLVNHFVKKHAPSRDISISRDAIDHLIRYRWPGNVRQLENEIIRATVMCGDMIEIEHLSEGLREFSFSSVEDLGELTMDVHLNRIRTQLIRTALKRTNGNRSKASELLGVSRFGLQKMISRLELKI